MAETARPYERRRATRIFVRFPVTMTRGKKKFNCQAMEFSEFGIFLKSTHKELVGQDVEVALALDSQEGILTLSGIVAYATEAGLGVRFKDINEEQRYSLNNYVLSHSQKV